MAGCLAAAAAAQSGARVQILERDRRPDGPQPRKGVAQSKQLHGLLEGGRMAAEALLPGLSESLLQHGSQLADSCENVRWFHGGVWKLQKRIDKPLYCQTRPFLEWQVREATSRLANVSFAYESSVAGLIHSDGTVRGARLDDGRELLADLVIDASGRGTSLPRWLEDWGYGQVSSRRVSLGLTYVSGIFRAPPRELLDAVLMIYPEPPHQKRAGLAMRVEGERCIVTLQGYHGEKPPTDLAGFRAYAQQLARPELGQLLAHAQLEGELSKHTFPFQIRYAYEELASFPSGLLPLGDAIASVDPVYGQGMSIAAMEALELRDWIAAGQLDQRALASITRVADSAWFLTSLEANRWAEAQGERPPAARAVAWYVDRLLTACAEDEGAVRAFYEVMHLTADLQSLAHPELLARVLWPEQARAMVPDAAQLLGLAVANLANPGMHQNVGPEVYAQNEPVRHFRVRADALQLCGVANGPVLRAGPGSAVLRVRQFALTSNNVSYALVAKQLGYFRFYPVASGWGCIPAWGFSEVVESHTPELQEGELLYGFQPMASHWTMQPGALTPFTVHEGSAHRAGFLPLYNTYFRMASNPLYRPQEQAQWSLFWPLFMTAFTVAHELLDGGMAEQAQVVISSASSKTALCLASILRSLCGERCTRVGLTSTRHAGFVAASGLYDRVLSYEEVAELPRIPSFFVDVAGHAATFAGVHHQLGAALQRSLMLGATNWHGFHGLAPDPTLPGPAPSFFFAPEHLAKRFASWGLDGFLQRAAEPWSAFLLRAASWLRVTSAHGERALPAAYLRAFGGDLDPREGIVARL